MGLSYWGRRGSYCNGRNEEEPQTEPKGLGKAGSGEEGFLFTLTSCFSLISGNYIARANLFTVGKAVSRVVILL